MYVYIVICINCNFIDLNSIHPGLWRGQWLGCSINASLIVWCDIDTAIRAKPPLIIFGLAHLLLGKHTRRGQELISTGEQKEAFPILICKIHAVCFFHPWPNTQILAAALVPILLLPSYTVQHNYKHILHLSLGCCLYLSSLLPFCLLPLYLSLLSL